jgi:peptidoglycan/LPS O-acetylase OafA/YrhL
VRLAAIGPWIGQAALPFALIVYLGMRDGGYDDIVRGEVGIAAWWILLAGAAVGVLPAQRLNRASWAGLGVLLALAAWTGLGIGWSESAERSVTEFARVASLLGILAPCKRPGRSGALSAESRAASQSSG